jgi:hypothetical protein
MGETEIKSTLISKLQRHVHVLCCCNNGYDVNAESSEGPPLLACSTATIAVLFSTVSPRDSEVVFGSKVQKNKRAKILPFAKSGKSFATRGVWIQMAKVLVKARLNIFSPSHIPFPAAGGGRGAGSGGGGGGRGAGSGCGIGRVAVSFCYLFLLFPFCHKVFGSKWKKKEQIFCYLHFC